jgi:hypothetical protein
MNFTFALQNKFSNVKSKNILNSNTKLTHHLRVCGYIIFWKEREFLSLSLRCICLKLENKLHMYRTILPEMLNFAKISGSERYRRHATRGTESFVSVLFLHLFK